MSDKLLYRITRAVAVVMVIGMLAYLFIGCCDPNKPRAFMRPFPNQPEIVVKAYDENCDSRLDYWQHYKHGQPFGNRIYINNGEAGRIDKTTKVLEW